MHIDACLAHLTRRDWLTQGPLSIKEIADVLRHRDLNTARV